MYFKIIFILLIIIITGCASTHNMMIWSSISSNYEYNKPKNIFIRASNYSKESAVNFDKYLKIALEKKGLLCVDNIDNAEKILEYRYDDSSNLYSSGYASRYFGLSNKVFEKSVFKEFGGRSVTVIEEGYSRLILRIYDTKLLSKNKPTIIWNSSIKSPSDILLREPMVAIKLLLDLYGKSKNYRGKFPESK